MGYQGAVAFTSATSLRKIPQRMLELVEPATEAMVDSGVDYMQQQVKINTPVSHDPDVEGWTFNPGGDGVHLRDEIHRTPVVREGDEYHAETGSDKDYAPYVEEGTGLYGPKHAKYLIMSHDPHGALVFPWHGQIVRFSHVWHPGSPGQHMFLIGGTLTEQSSELWRQSGDVIFRDGMK